MNPQSGEWLQMPEVQVLEPSLDFGHEVHMGCTARVPITLSNSTLIPASAYPTLVELLSSFSRFPLSFRSLTLLEISLMNTARIQAAPGV